MSDEAIPDDVMQAAEAVTDAIYAAGQDTWLAAGTTEIIARAILAERTRCAAIAQKLYDDWDRAPSWEVSKLPPNAAAAASSIRSSHE